MVPHLRRVVVERRLVGLVVRRLDDLLERLGLEVGALHERVRLVDVALVVLAVMEADDVRRDARRERRVRVRQLHERERTRRSDGRGWCRCGRRLLLVGMRELRCSDGHETGTDEGATCDVRAHVEASGPGLRAVQRA